jgi:putative transposase
MGQSLVRNYVHLVFSTKHRQPYIQAPFEDTLHQYLGGTLNRMGCQTIIVGGYTDHVHILFLLPATKALMKVLEELKANSSKWMKSQDESLENFYWQDGYGAFSVNPSEVEVVVGYIKNQHEHHRKKTFQDEYRSILKKYKVAYDEKYIWQ